MIKNIIYKTSWFFNPLIKNVIIKFGIFAKPPCGVENIKVKLGALGRKNTGCGRRLGVVIFNPLAPRKRLVSGVITAIIGASGRITAASAVGGV